MVLPHEESQGAMALLFEALVQKPSREEEKSIVQIINVKKKRKLLVDWTAIDQKELLHIIGEALTNQRPGKLDAEPLVVGALVVKRVPEMAPDRADDIERPGHRRFALRGLLAQQLGVFGVDIGRRSTAARLHGDMPAKEKDDEDR